VIVRPACLNPAREHSHIVGLLEGHGDKTAPLGPLAKETWAQRFKVLRGASLRVISVIQKRTQGNSRATGRRIHALRKGFEGKERSRGYRVVTSSKNVRNARSTADS
jgi:hypothetical protein